MWCFFPTPRRRGLPKTLGVATRAGGAPLFGNSPSVGGATRTDRLRTPGRGCGVVGCPGTAPSVTSSTAARSDGPGGIVTGVSVAKRYTYIYTAVIYLYSILIPLHIIYSIQYRAFPQSADWGRAALEVNNQSDDWLYFGASLTHHNVRLRAQLEHKESCMRLQ